jgi:hypothetical protein
MFYTILDVLVTVLGDVCSGRVCRVVSAVRYDCPKLARKQMFNVAFSLVSLTLSVPN